MPTLVDARFQTRLFPATISAIKEIDMGMYDTVRFYGDGAPVCAAGHPLCELQTKDLECALGRYAVHHERLYRAGTTSGETAHPRDDGRLSLLREQIAEPVALTAEVTAYTHCDDCRPVLYLRDTTSAWGDYVHERRPWCEWQLVFVAGALDRREAVRVETREMVAHQLDQVLIKFYWLREQNELRKKPSTAELVDWISALLRSGISIEKVEAHIPFVGALLKKEQDVDALTQYDAKGGRYPKSWQDMGPRYNQ
jgi:hypothetical protein